MKNSKVVRLAQYAVLVAIMLLMGFTPLGYIRVGPIEISTMMLPVAIAAIVMGPLAGTLLGFVFGLTSFAQCFMGSAFGAMLVGINPFFTLILCIVPRTLMGFLVGIIFKALYRIDKTKLASFAVASICSALLNTVLFVFTLIVLFYSNDTFVKTMTEWGFDMSAIIPFFAAFIGLNGIVEAIFSLVAGTAITKPLHKAFAEKQ